MGRVVQRGEMTHLKSVSMLASVLNASQASSRSLNRQIACSGRGLNCAC